MPNIRNVDEPIILLGNGRSGTTLMTGVFNKYLGLQSIGETTNLIFGVFRSIECSIPYCGNPAYHDETVRDIAVEKVRQLMVDLFPSDEKLWFQKPIMLPQIKTTFSSESEFFSWYWDTLYKIFPRAKVIFILRNPVDVLNSYQKRWNWPVEGAAKDHMRLNKLLLHPKANVTYGFRFEDLMDDPQAVLSSLCNNLDIPFQESMLSAFRENHAPNPKCDTQEVDKQKIISQEYMSILDSVCERYLLNKYEV
ncbi:sulfotransferase family protein [Microbulbifer sp. SSSA008]|uniref:sulfotransferase family protein n=1 Tax=Microbulbifer sp. SSSA008 TaxID=3243380 RepID=UPI00403A4F2B